jgi:ABC-2 type transport system permease protein
VTRVFAALKWRLLLNGLFRTRLGWLAAVGAVFGLGLSVVVALGAESAASEASSALAFRAAGLGTYLVVFSAWVFGPLLVGVDETVDPTRLALVPLTRRELLGGLVTASVIGFGPVAAAIVFAGVVVGFVQAGGNALFVVAAVVVGFAMALTASRALATLLTRVQRSRRGRDISVIVAAFVGAGLWLGTQLAPHLSSSAERQLFDVLRWTPPGIVGQAIVDAGNGELAAAALGIVVGAAFVVLFGWAWIAGVERLLVDSGAAVSHVRTGVTSTRERAAWLRGGELRASARKELRYLVRSPARRSATLVAVALGTGFVLLQVLQRPGTPGSHAVLLAPLGGFFAVSAVNNQLGHDGASLWLEVTAGGPRRAELLGRGISWLPALVGPSIPVAIVVGAISGGWSYVPLGIALAIAVAGVPLGVGSYMSVVAPIIVPDDSNPFTNRNANTGQGCLVGFVALIALVLDAFLLVPVAVAVVVAADHLPALALTIAGIALYAAGVWAAGSTLAIRRLRGREPELLVALSPRV